ncbi:MAG: hypothetical protein ACI9LM_001484 [Alteromonadaceae bacterium]|jgi:hypothetical protein
MRGNSKLPFYKQITSNLIAIFLTSSMLLCLVVSLFLYQENQLQTAINYNIPQLQQSYEQQRYFIDSDHLVEKAINSETATVLSKQYQQYQQKLQALSNQATNQKIHVKKLALSNEKLSKVVEKVKSNEPRNNQLKQNTIIQLQLIIDSLTKTIDEISTQKKQLQQQIVADKVKDKLTVSRAKAHVEVLGLSYKYNEILALVSTSLLDFKALDIQVPISQFIAINHNVEQIIQLWTQLNDNEQSIKDLIVHTEIEQLNHLLFTEQKVMAKWHSHIRLAENVFTALLEQKKQLRLMAEANDSNIQVVSHTIPRVITRLADNMAIKLTPNLYRTFLLVCLGLGIMVLMIQLVRLRLRIKKHSADNIQVYEALLKADMNGVVNEAVKIKCAENRQVAEIVNKLVKPAHSEFQYQALLADHQQHLTMIAKKNVVVHWQYRPKNTYLHNDALLVSLLADDKTQPIKSWRHWFDKNTVATLISCAKKVTVGSDGLSCFVKTSSGKHLDVYINKNEQGWFGTLADNSNVSKLEEDIRQLNTDVVEMAEMLRKQDIVNADKLSKMIIRTMLQSQSVSVGSSLSSLQVYRQLTRIFDWCRQTKIRTLLQQNNHTVSARDVSFHDELHAAVFNAMSEAHLQRNQIFLHADAQLVSQANIDVRLFHRTILGVCRLMLAEQFKSTLQFNVKVADKKAGQQIVRFEFIALLSKPIKKTPEIVSLLITENELLPKNTPEVIRYLKILLTSLNSKNVQVQQNGQGFLLSFDLPITVLASQNEDRINLDLKQANILVVSGNSTCNEVIKQNLNATTAVVEVLNKASYFTQQVTIKHLNHQKLDLVVLADDCFKSDYGLISQHIASLPKGLQPKLMVMQSPFAARLHVNGLYNQANYPLCRLSFQQSVQNLLLSDKANNCLLAAQELQQYQYLPTQVEVLFAVSSPEKHQILIRVLQWLGLHIHIVCHAEALIKHWQSGRYLVLFTELNLSPYIELDIGKSIRRGIFTLPETTIDGTKEALKTVAKHWINIRLPAQLDIKNLTADLAPWLKPKTSLALETTIFNQDPVMQDKVNESEILHTTALNKVLLEENKPIEIDVKNHSLDKTVQVFNLQQYAKNQGSPQLAVYMLDVYLKDIDITIDCLGQAIKDNKPEVIQTALNTLLMTTEILSADDFQLCCQKLKQAISDHDDNNISLWVNEMKQQQKLLVNFAEAI